MSDKDKNSQKSIDESSNQNQNGINNNSDDFNNITEWINDLTDSGKRVNALVELSKKRDSFSELAIYLWHSPGVISALLQEILETYKLLAPPTLTLTQSNHTCNVLALFQCIAAHPETRPHFLSAQIPIFLYPFLNTLNKNRPFEYLRLTALGVIGALVKVDNSDVINFLLSTEIIPLCLRIMERGSELSKTVATFIVQRILLDDNGLNYVCNTAERFYAVSSVLNSMMNGNPTSRLIKHIIRCYARLSENSRVSQILKENMPKSFKDMNFINSLDESSKRWLQSLSRSLSNFQSQSGANVSMGSKLLNFENLSSNSATQNIGNAANMSSNANYILNSSNNNSNNMMSVNSMPAMNQIYDGYYYNPAMNNLNGFIPANNDQNGSNMYYGNSNYYMPPMAKMYPNSMGNGHYGVNSMNHAVNSGNGSYNNMDKKL